MNLQEKLIKFLELGNWYIVESTTKKAITLKHDKRDYCFFVGKKGSLRRGKIYSKSYVSNYSVEIIDKYLLKNNIEV